MRFDYICKHAIYDTLTLISRSIKLELRKSVVILDLIANYKTKVNL